MLAHYPEKVADFAFDGDAISTVSGCYRNMEIVSGHGSLTISVSGVDVSLFYVLAMLPKRSKIFYSEGCE